MQPTSSRIPDCRLSVVEAEAGRSDWTSASDLAGKMEIANGFSELTTRGPARRFEGQLKDANAATKKRTRWMKLHSSAVLWHASAAARVASIASRCCLPIHYHRTYLFRCCGRKPLPSRGYEIRGRNRLAWVVPYRAKTDESTHQVSLRKASAGKQTRNSSGRRLGENRRLCRIQQLYGFGRITLLPRAPSLFVSRD